MACSSTEQREQDTLLESVRNGVKNDDKKRNKSGCYSLLWRKFGLPCSPFERLDYSSLIIVEKVLFEEYSNFNGRFEYYALQRGRHGSVCLKRVDDVGSTKAVLVELLVRRPEGKTKEWFIQMRRHDWNPFESGVVPGTHKVSEHTWNETTGLDAVAKCATKFGHYNPVKRNCQHFVEELRESMIKEGPSPDVPGTQTYWRIGEYLQEKYGVTLTLTPSDTLLDPNREDLEAEKPTLKLQETEV